MEKIVEKLRKIKNNVEMCLVYWFNLMDLLLRLNHEDGYKWKRLELIAELAFKSLLINKNITMDKSLIKKPFFRKHGKDRYYGQ